MNSIIIKAKFFDWFYQVEIFNQNSKYQPVFVLFDCASQVDNLVHRTIFDDHPIYEIKLLDHNLTYPILSQLVIEYINSICKQNFIFCSYGTSLIISLLLIIIYQQKKIQIFIFNSVLLDFFQNQQNWLKSKYFTHTWINSLLSQNFQSLNLRSIINWIIRTQKLSLVIINDLDFLEKYHLNVLTIKKFWSNYANQKMIEIKNQSESIIIKNLIKQN
ncbi:hypothetical protein MCAV_04380 [[Mycoplasma] cavipharyngis]|uniref:hypothetical protein n=1 Tax=[Mycoplasma] cavipharyngis TaxID=92757 RepID=UPI0037043231